MARFAKEEEERERKRKKKTKGQTSSNVVACASHHSRLKLKRDCAVKKL
jgi:ribosome assembly protein YihI (activator of Der GTPase)